MKKLTILSLFLFIFALGTVAQTQKKTQYPKPTKFVQEISTIVENKTRTYYLISASKESVIKLNGPGTLKLVTRAQFISGQKESVGYEITYSINGGETKKLKVKSAKRSTKATYLDGKMGIPGQVKEFEIEIPRGNNTIEIKLMNGEIPVTTRYVFTHKKDKKQDWIDFAPTQSVQVVDLITHETSASYYRFSDEKPMKIEVLGPTQLRVFSRVEFDYQKRGRVNYRLQVTSDGKVINTYQLSSRRSEVSVYKVDKDLVPGKASEFLIEVPEGKHTYEIVPLDKDKRTILGRIMIVKKDVKKSK